MEIHIVLKYNASYIRQNNLRYHARTDVCEAKITHLKAFCKHSSFGKLYGKV